MPNLDSNTTSRGGIIFYNQAAFSMGPSDPSPWPHAGWIHWRTDLGRLYYWDGTVAQWIVNANLATTVINSAIATHEADTTNVHGIADTAALALAAALCDTDNALGFTTAGTSTTKNLVSGTSFVRCLGRATRAHTQISVRYRMTQAAVTITWAELGIYTGAFVIGGSPTLTRVGYADLSAVINSTGAKTTAVTVSGVVPGDMLWAALGDNAVTPGQIRAGLGDEILFGFQHSGAFQPSVTSPTTPTQETGTAASPWFSWAGN